jgi:pimeloyl-ACP methyl ester carboxylesterase
LRQFFREDLNADTISGAMPVFYCIWAFLALLAAPAAAQPDPPALTHTYTVFIRATPVGREQLSIRRENGDYVITGDSRLTAINVVTRRAELRYAPDWTPRSLLIESTVSGTDITLRTTFKDGTAVTEGTEGSRAIARTDTVSRGVVVLPDFFFGAYGAMALRLASQPGEAELRAYVGLQAEVPFRVVNVSTSRMQAGTSTFTIRRFDLLFTSATGEVALNLAVDDAGALVRLYLPSQAIDIVRDDLVTSTSRTEVHSNPGDEAVFIPGAGFNFGATLTRPKNGPARLPAVILIGALSGDRDGRVAGVPVLGQLAGALAEQGFLVVRYDARGSGQSGGRSESATFGDFADDARGVARWLASRKDVDSDRIAVVGHGEGAWVALLAASRDRRFAGVVSIAAPAATGAQLVLEQQEASLDRIDATPADRTAKIELQKRIHAAVLSGKGWETVPKELRKQADTPWFQSYLQFDPAEVLEDIRQPLLLVHGQLDRQVPLSHVDRLAELAKKASRSRAIEVLTVRGVNHLLTPATTGEVGEYASLTDRNVSRDVTGAIATWLTKNFAARR